SGRLAPTFRARGYRRQVNSFRTMLLLAALTALFMAPRFLVGGPRGAIIAFLFAAGMNLFTYWNADRIVLRMHDAHEVDARSCPLLYDIIHRLEGRGEVPTARTYLVA